MNGGWLVGSVSPLFSQYLEYNAGADPQYNGNISGQNWRHGTNALQSYAYSYDKLNRLLQGEMAGGLGRETLSYDKMGNILGLERTGTSSTAVDQLSYSYAYNRLSSVSDAAGGASGPYQLGGTTAYGYDLNGNMTGRVNGTNGGNNISSVSYNHLGLAQAIIATAGTTTYTYDATGRKLRSVFGSRVTDYIDGVEYEDGTLNFIHMEEGRIVKSGSTFGYEYILKDHLGNSRSGFKGTNPTIASVRSDYYPFGLQYQSGIVGGTPENKYLYNGKELQDGTNFYDYGARLYDPIIGRWGAVDPMAESYDDMSSYHYAGNNPIRFIDLDGMMFEDTSIDNIVKENIQKLEIRIDNKQTEDVDKALAGTIVLPEALVTGSKILNRTIPVLGAATIGWSIGSMTSKNIHNITSSIAALLTHLGVNPDMLYSPELRPKIVKSNTNEGEDGLPEGFSETKEFGKPHGQKVYKKGSKYYSKDIDSHSGGSWKVFEKQGNKLKRVGTADKNLKIFKN